MPSVIRSDRVVDDAWTVLRPAGQTDPAEVGVGPDPTVVPLPVYLAQERTLATRPDIGVWLAGHDDPEALAPHLPRLPLVAIDFPKFTDGRGYSLAWLLRSRYRYRGELRAIGDVLQDQISYMLRVGFDAFALRADKDPHAALASLRPFSEAYQGSWDRAAPAYRRAPRAVGRRANAEARSAEDPTPIAVGLLVGG